VSKSAQKTYKVGIQIHGKVSAELEVSLMTSTSSTVSDCCAFQSGDIVNKFKILPFTLIIGSRSRASDTAQELGYIMVRYSGPQWRPMLVW